MRATLGLLAEDRTLPMSYLLAAIGATVAALLELAVVPHLGVDGAPPPPWFGFGGLWSVAGGIGSGRGCAFVGGWVLAVLAQRPLGSSAFALLVTSGAAAMAGRLLSRARPLAAIVLGLAFSLVNSVLL